MKLTTAMGVFGLSVVGFGLYKWVNPVSGALNKADEPISENSYSEIQPSEHVYVDIQVVETLEDYPYEVTSVPVNVKENHENALGWFDNNRLAFLEIDDDGTERVATWSEEQGVKTYKKNIKAICARDGKIGYIKNTASGRAAYFGPVGLERELLSVSELSLSMCAPTGHQLMEEAPNKISGRYVDLVDNAFKLWEPGKVYGENQPGEIYVNGRAVANTHFVGSIANHIKYVEHLNAYFIDRLSNYRCHGTDCNDWNYHYAYFIDRKGKQFSVKWDLPWKPASEDSSPELSLTPMTKVHYLYFDPKHAQQAPEAPFQEVGLHLLDIRNNQVELLLKGVPVNQAISPDGCKVAVTRLIENDSSSLKRRMNLAVIDFCKPRHNAIAFRQ